MTCDTIRNELVAYRDGELLEQERARIAAHLRTCPACTQEEAQLARIGHLLAGLERIMPSPDFAATFWRRLEQEGAGAHEDPAAQENRFTRWWRKWLTGWQWAPALAGAASLLIFFGYILSGRPPTTTTVPVPPDVPEQVATQPGLFVNYKVIADLERFARFDEIAALESAPEPASEVAREEELPPAVLENPSFFVHYPMLQKMEQLQNLETVLGLPAGGDEHGRG